MSPSSARRWPACPRPRRGKRFRPSIIETICDELEQRLDRVDGGFGAAPKFPQATSLDFLWRAWKRTGRNSLRQGVVLTLDHISQGGVYDHLGGGFARYSTDNRWLVPHFEKMLYDNAQLIELLTEVWQDERRELYRLRVTETIQWMTREMRAPGGGFASSLDADSEGEEGKFYGWSEAEIQEALGARAPFFERAYGVSREGNWEHGKSVLNRLGSIELLDEETEAALARDRAALFALRERRVQARMRRQGSGGLEWIDDRRHRKGGLRVRAARLARSRHRGVRFRERRDDDGRWSSAPFLARGTRASCGRPRRLRRDVPGGAGPP